jgi:hypothetical protein
MAPTFSPKVWTAVPAASGVSPCAFTSCRAASAISLTRAAFSVTVSPDKVARLAHRLPFRFRSGKGRRDPGTDGKAHRAEEQGLAVKEIGQIRAPTNPVFCSAVAAFVVALEIVSAERDATSVAASGTVFRVRIAA